MSKEQPVQTLAVFVLDTDDAARGFLKVVQKIDEADANVAIVDAAIADRTKRGRVKVHQTTDRGGMKGGLRGGAFGVVVGTILLGPVGAVVGGAAGGVLAGLRNHFHDIGIDDKFMKQVASEVEKGRSALFVLYEGDWSASIGAVEDAVKAHHALLIQSTLPPERAAELRALVEPAAEELGGEEVVADYEVETEPEAEAVEAPQEAETAPPARSDDLTNLDGIGPKAAKALTAAGITTYEALAETNEPQLRNALHAADMVAPANMAGWPMQAAFAAKGDWRGLAKYNQKSASTKAPSAKAKAPEAAPAAAAKPDDLTQLNGIGPRIASLLADGGVTTFAELQHMSDEELRAIISAGGALPPASLPTWRTQASFAAKGDWQGLTAYNKRHQK